MIYNQIKIKLEFDVLENTYFTCLILSTGGDDSFESKLAS